MMMGPCDTQHAPEPVILNNKRKMVEHDEGIRGREFRTTSKEEESAHRIRMEYQNAILVLENVRREKIDIIQQASVEIGRLRKEKEDVIKQSVGEITRLLRELDGRAKASERDRIQMRKQSEIIEYLRKTLAFSESSYPSMEPFNHIGAF